MRVIACSGGGQTRLEERPQPALDAGELLLAIHHRAMNANFMSDLPTRIWKWMGDLAADMRYDFPDYPKAKPRRT